MVILPKTPLKERVSLPCEYLLGWGHKGTGLLPACSWGAWEGAKTQGLYLGLKVRVVQKLMTLAPQHGGVSTCMQASWPHSTCCRVWGVLCSALTSLRGSGKRVATMGWGGHGVQVATTVPEGVLIPLGKAWGQDRSMGPGHADLLPTTAVWTPLPSCTSASLHRSSMWPSSVASLGE